MYENNSLNHHPGFHMFYKSYVSIHSFSFFFHIFPPLPSPGLVFQCGPRRPPLQVQVPGGQALSSVEAQQLSTTARDVGKPQPGGRMGKLDKEKLWKMMEIQVHEIWDPLFSSKKPRYPNVQSTT